MKFKTRQRRHIKDSKKKQVIDVVEAVYKSKSEGMTDVWSTVFYEFELNTENITFRAVENLEAAVKEIHIIVTVTPSRKPIIKKAWIQKGTHITCIGADMEGKQEIDSEIMPSALIFADDLEHCKKVGEIEILFKQGVIHAESIIGEIGDLILNKVNGRTSGDQITIFDTTGMALLDIATAEVALQLAEKNKLGSKSKL